MDSIKYIETSFFFLNGKNPVLHVHILRGHVRDALSPKIHNFIKKKLNNYNTIMANNDKYYKYTVLEIVFDLCLYFRINLHRHIV